MLKPLRKGSYIVRTADGPDDIRAAQALRHAAFVEGIGGQPRSDGLDADRFDALCTHILIEDARSGALVCCFRLLPLSGAQIGDSYAAQFYELSGLQDYAGPMVEMGRFCIDPAVSDPNILRIAWGALTQFVDAAGIELLFGCSSFHGTQAEAYFDSFSVLAERHQAPRRWLPRVKAPKVFRFAGLKGRVADRKLGMRRMPPLLKSYISMGGWVSDHAVVDDDLGTLHVFTGLEIKGIPLSRKRLLRGVAS